MKRKNEQIEENDDFLSDDILKQAEEFDKTRKKTEPKKKQPKYAIPVKSPKVLEQEQREKALQTGMFMFVKSIVYICFHYSCLFLFCLLKF